jgi:tetratricopeptide (TPR) repeat protein
LLAVFAFLVVWFPLTNTDIWWHLAAGRSMCQEGSFLYSDPFSLSTAGQPWINLHWLFQIAAYLGHAAGGPAALVIGKCALFSVAAVILLWGCETLAGAESGCGAPKLRPVGIAFLALAILAGRHLVFARPVVFTLVYMSLVLFLLAKFVRKPSKGYLIGLMGIQVLWANTQPLFVLGPVILACFLLGEGLSTLAARLRIPGFARTLGGKPLAMLALALAGTLAVSLITPYGFDTLQLPFRLFGRIDPTGASLFTWNVSENIPPWALARTGSGPHDAFQWLGVAAAASFVLNWKRISLTRLALFSAMLVLALMANRNILLFNWTAALVFVVNAGNAMARKSESPASVFFARVLRSPLLALGTVLALGLPLGSALAREGSIARVSPFRVPTGIAAHLEKLPGEGRLFNAIRYGGYLIWELYPASRPYIDGRLVLRSADQFAEYLRVLDQPGKFEDLDDRFGFTAAVLPVTMPDRYQKLIAHLYRDPDWHLVFTDGTQTLFARQTSGSPGGMDLSSGTVVDRVVAAVMARHHDDSRVREQALVHLGILLNLAGQPDRAEEVLAPLEGRRAKSLLARTYASNRKPMAALTLASELVQSDPDDVDNLVLMAWLSIASGDYDLAARRARQALDREPHNAEARQILGELKRRLQSGRQDAMDANR